MDGGTGGLPRAPCKDRASEKSGPDFFCEVLKMAAIMSVCEPRPRGTVLGERADGRRVGEAEHYFRCKACNGWIDARDLAWIEDHEGPLPHPAQDGIQ
jgi:hypothetical protein